MIRLAQNLYGYVNDDPLNKIDPTGNSWWSIGSAVLGVAGFVATIGALAVGGGFVAAAIGLTALSWGFSFMAWGNNEMSHRELAASTVFSFIGVLKGGMALSLLQHGIGAGSSAYGLATISTKKAKYKRFKRIWKKMKRYYRTHIKIRRSGLYDQPANRRHYC